MSEISFLNKEKTYCPICRTGFFVEHMRTGRGRFNSSGIDVDLRRLYTPTKKYGLIYPLIYNMLVCPACYFSAMPNDFLEAKNYDAKGIKKNEPVRKKALQEIIKKEVDFTSPRNLNSGLASFFLGLTCYNFYKVKSIASVQKFLCALRAAWCCHDIYETNKEDSYHKLALFFRKLALDCLEVHMAMMYDTKEKYTEVDYYGPDLDHDYSYDGFVYLGCYLGYFFSDLNRTPEEQHPLLINYRNRLAKVFGMGKVDKSSPSPLKNSARNTYDEIKRKLEELEKKMPQLKEKSILEDKK